MPNTTDYQVSKKLLGVNVDNENLFKLIEAVNQLIAKATPEIKESILSKNREFKWNILHWAAFYEYNLLLASLVDLIPNEFREELINQTDSFGRNVLHYAAFRGDIVLIKKLLDSFKSDIKFVNTKDKNNILPIMCAARRHHWNVVLLLAENGAYLHYNHHVRETWQLLANFAYTDRNNIDQTIKDKLQVLIKDAQETTKKSKTSLIMKRNPRNQDQDQDIQNQTYSASFS
ncbi:ankyrin repeat domain-containing protein [Rickettsiales endosymbiont of Stachyamoeba lipophora]|uniref:ankyrin repeat domain-containing protein n=1 Tax=Rickettsiales endosymbiont of Stachyamoeba lipophora TaxID=2486578 RepID=UPI000F64C442|nr:ankyrin repeat domain-containing protein [Rickettsiales endosymbiont of Stachyamoeba lipophora]AZL15096.1 ankyrin repeat domain-containing protein [Rickettsiales endosymbiont of Stachyamoeba lipophora]